MWTIPLSATFSLLELIYCWLNELYCALFELLGFVALRSLSNCKHWNELTQIKSNKERHVRILYLNYSTHYCDFLHLLWLLYCIVGRGMVCVSLNSCSGTSINKKQRYFPGKVHVWLLRKDSSFKFLCSVSSHFMALMRVIVRFSSVRFCVSVKLREVKGADFPLSFPIFLVEGFVLLLLLILLMYTSSSQTQIWFSLLENRRSAARI